MKSYVQKGGAVAASRALRRRADPRGGEIDGQPVASRPMTLPLFRPATTPARASPSCSAASAVLPPERSSVADRAADHPRHDVRRAALRRRRGDGRRPPGHRAATSISHRTMEKVFPADRHSRRRHRRRGRAGDGDGQALPAPARALREGRGHRAQPRGQGQPAVDDGAAATCRRRCRAWSSCRSSPATTSARRQGRLFSYDVTGGRYEEHDFAATGSGSLHAGTVIKLGYREGIEPRRRRRPRHPGAVRGRRRGLGHRRPRPRAGHLPDAWPRSPPTASSRSPTTSSPSASARCSSGCRRPRARRRPDRRRRCRAREVAADEHAVLRRARAGDEGPGRLRPQGHRPRPQPRRRRLRRRHRDLRREPVEHAAQGQRDLRPHRLRRRRPVQRVRPAAHRRRAPRRPQGLPVQPRGRRRPQPGQRVRPDPRPGLHPRDQADGGRDPRRRGRATHGDEHRRTSCSTSSTTAP